MEGNRVPANVNDQKKTTFFRNLAIVIIVFVVFFTLPSLCGAQWDHDHGHSHDQPPSFKYSRQANEELLKEEHHHSHHDHDHDHDHHHHHHHHGHEHSHGDGDEHSHGGHHHEESANRKARDVPLDMTNIWLHSILSTLLISAAPFLILYFIPLDNTAEKQPTLKILLAFASGGLLGDAFLHLIPHAVSPHSHNDDHGSAHNHSHEAHSHGHDMSVGLWVLAGIITFLSVEKMVRLIKGGHGHSHGPPAKKTNDPEKSGKKKSTDDKKGKNSVAKKTEEIEVAGYLNLAADFTHNFTDGLAIGASYLAGNYIGIVTTVTILLHEVPHEIGDFAILIKSGCSKRKAMGLQLLTALGALAGTVIALLGSSGEASPWVLPFTAGGFIYIATVSVLPELLEESTKLGQSIKEISALLAGVGLMVIIANLE